MQVEEERDKGNCPFPCSLTSLLSMNCRARAQGLSHQMQTTQVRYNNRPGMEGTMLVEADGRVRLANNDNRTYSLDDYNLESFKASELKKLRPIHVVTSEPTLHLCLPPQPASREEQSPTEQEQDSDVFFDFDLITPPEDYACDGESTTKSQETIAEENEKQERPESGCVTSVTSPIMFSINFDLPLSNAPSPKDDGAPDDHSRASDVDLETVRQILVSSQNQTNSEEGHDQQFGVRNSDVPDFIGVVKCANYSKPISSYSDNITSSSSDCESSSEVELNISEEEKELISKEKMSRNMSYYLPPPSSYQIFRNKASDMDNNEGQSPIKPKHKAVKIKHKKKKYKSHSPNINESSESRDSPILTPEFPMALSSSPESSSVQSTTVHENNKPTRLLIIRSNSFDYFPKSNESKRIKTSHSFEMCARDSMSYADEEVQKNIQQSVALPVCNTKRNKPNTNNYSKGDSLQSTKRHYESNVIQANVMNGKFGDNILKETKSDDIKTRHEIEGGQAVSYFNEEDILKEINEAIAILKNQNDDPKTEKLAKYENCKIDELGTKLNKRENPFEQVAVLSHNSTLDAADKCQNFVPVSQLCEVCEEVPYIELVGRNEEKCDITIIKEVTRYSSFEDAFQANALGDATYESDMPRSKGRAKVKKASTGTLSPPSQNVTELPETATSPNDPTPSTSISNTESNSTCLKLCNSHGYSNPNEDVPLNHTCASYNTLQYYNSENGSVFHVDSSKYISDVFCENISEKNCFGFVKETSNGICESSLNITEENSPENCHKRQEENISVKALEDSVLCEEVSLKTCEVLNVNHIKCEILAGCEDKVCIDYQSSSSLHKLSNNNNNNNNNNLIEILKNNTCNHVSSDSNFYSEDSLDLGNNLQCSSTQSTECTKICNTKGQDLSICNSNCNDVSPTRSNSEYSEENNHRQCMQYIEDDFSDTKSTTTSEREHKTISPVSDSTSSVMNFENVENINSEESKENLGGNKNESYTSSNEPDILSDEIELLPSEECETSENKDEEESDEEILVSNRFRKISAYTERITKLSEDDDDELPPPPTQVILIDYNNEPEETTEEEIKEEKNISADLASELNKLSLAEPTVEGPSDESERSSEERETDVERQQRIKRSSSLRCGKTPPGTPGRKKIVRFADALGLDLADVRTFLDGVPTVPASAFCDLEVESEGGIPSYGSYTAAASAAAAVLQSQAQRILTPMFQQPGALPDFYDRLREQKVVLENVSVGTDLSVKGVVRVINENYHKKVYIRYTFDHWRNFHEATASYIDGSGDGFSDRFSFLLWGSFLQSNGSLVFCVKYCVNDNQYWDNNRGSNYVLQCYSAPPPHTLHGKPQNNGSMDQPQPDARHRLSQQAGVSGKSGGGFSAFMDSPSTPSDPWAHKFF